MADLPPEYHELKSRVERDRLELAETEAELKKLGDQLKENYIHQMLETPALEPGSSQPVSRPNRLCRKCFNSCKQPESVRVYRCSRFEPLD
jgi:hypothetical protein